jgi:hypothetical protein
VGGGAPSFSGDVTTGPRRTRSWWNWLLLVPFLALAFPVLYARQEPALWGLPFFYWYQFAWLFITVLITWIVYAAGRK